jgi:ADP-heptose:LPS heptosyltransferase
MIRQKKNKFQMIKNKKDYKILIYSGGDAIGDALYKLNFMFFLRSSYPDAQITFVAGQGKSEYLLSLHSISKKIFNVMYDNFNYGKKGYFLRDFFKKLPLNDIYDVVIDTQSSYKCTLLLKRIKHKIFISSSLNWFFSDLKPEEKKIQSLNDRLLRMISLLNKYNNVEKNFFKHKFIDLPNYDFLVNQILPNMDKEYFGIAPGAGDLRKIWPLKKFISVAKYYEKNYIPVFFLGPNEKHFLSRIKSKIPSAVFPETVNICHNDVSGPLLVIALSKKLKFCISNDSGIGHMFAASNIPQISLFSLSNPRKYAPINTNLIIIDSKDWGSKNPSSIPTKAVISQINKFLHSE